MIISVVITLIQKNFPGMWMHIPREIQVMTPTRKGLLGVERLNTILQRYLNPPSPRKNGKGETGKDCSALGIK